MENIEKRHYASIDPHRRKLTIKYKNEIVAVSEKALLLKEVGKSVYDPVFYFPKEDVKVDLINENDRSSFCPIKGAATYWALKDHPMEDYFAWSYEKAHPKSKKIEGYITFNLKDLEMISEPLQ